MNLKTGDRKLQTPRAPRALRAPRAPSETPSTQWGQSALCLGLGFPQVGGATETEMNDKKCLSSGRLYLCGPLKTIANFPVFFQPGASISCALIDREHRSKSIIHEERRRPSKVSQSCRVGRIFCDEFSLRNLCENRNAHGCQSVKSLQNCEHMDESKMKTQAEKNRYNIKWIGFDNHSYGTVRS